MMQLLTAGAIQEATVLQIDQDAGLVHVETDDDLRLWAQPAVPASSARRVLIATTDDKAYIIGVLARDPETVTTSDGVSATCDEQSLRVTNAAGEVILEHDAQSGRTTLRAARDVVIDAPGRLDLRARDGIRLASPAPIDIASRTGVRLTALNGESSTIETTPSGVRVGAPALRVKTSSASVSANRTTVHGERLDADYQAAHIVVRRLETVSDIVIARTKRLYRYVEGLAQAVVGRKRTIVRSTYHLKTERLHANSDGDTRINGKSINIG